MIGSNNWHFSDGSGAGPIIRHEVSSSPGPTLEASKSEVSIGYWTGASTTRTYYTYYREPQ